MDKLLDVSIKQLTTHLEKGLIIENEIALNRILDELYQLQQENKQLKEENFKLDRENQLLFESRLDLIKEYEE